MRIAICFGVVLTSAALGGAGARADDWPYTGGTQAGLRYSSLTQIHRGNVKRLQVAWIYRTGELERRGPALAKAQSFADTPTLVEGALIVCTPLGRIIALDPATGIERWHFDPNRDPQPARAYFPKCRGVSQWTDTRTVADAPCHRRLLFGTWDFKVYAIDARTGARCTDFGRNGEVALEPGKPLVAGDVLQVTSAPAVAGDRVIVGSLVIDNMRADAPSGKVRALDARTGAIAWEFDPIPRDPSDPAAATWGGTSATRTGNANVWTTMSVDAERDLIFLPTTSPGPDFFGGLRPGENRYANSLVALRASTGAMVWHYQITHHDLWDYDLPAQPLLIDINRAGVIIPVVVQLTKQGLVFVFNRESGEPLFPINERPVPQSGAPGEWLSPTQPIPSLPPPLVAQSVGPDDAWGFTFIDRWLCRRRIETLRHGPIYTPPSVQGTIQMPSFVGGANWGGGAYDPVRGLLVVNTLHVPGVVKLVPREQHIGSAEPPSPGEEINVNAGVTFPMRGTPYVVETRLLMSPIGAPCTAPPWGRLAAIDLARGSIKWQVPLGSLDKLAPIPLPEGLGAPASGGAIVTAAGLAFIGATLDDRLRAFDVESGKQLWEADLPAGGQATPMTYSVAGRQYLVIAAGGHALFRGTPGDYVIAYALPPGK